MHLQSQRDTSKHSTTTIHQKEQWWRCLFEQSEDALLVCNKNGEVIEANRRSAQLLSLQVKSGKSHNFLIFNALTAATAARLGDFFRRGLVRQETIPGITLICEGQLCLMADLYVTPLSDNYFLITIKDASRRWRMESHIQRLMTAVDSTSDVIFLTDAELKIAFVNAAFQTVTGYTIEEALGKKDEFLRAPSESDKIKEYIAKVTSGFDWRGDLLNVRNDGASYPVEVTISPIFDKRGQFLGYASFERDVSLKRKLEEDLKREKNLTQSIINSIDAAVYTLDLNYKIIQTNVCWKNYPENHGWLSFSEPPKIGRSILDYVEDDEKRHKLTEIFSEVVSNNIPKELQAADNRRFWLIKITPLIIDNQIQGLNYVVTDQTNFHELQQQLYQAQKMEIIGALAAGVAHDFNNLLQAIRGNISLTLMDNNLPEKSVQRLTQADKAATRAEEISKQLLSFSRQTEESQTILDFNIAIQEAAKLALRSLKANVELQLRPTSSPLKVKIDPTRAQQLLLNLCVNALDAMPNGGTLTIKNEIVSLTENQLKKIRATPDSQIMCCSVTDTGAGIPPEILPRIFEPFFTTKGVGKGTGLGLSIVQGVVSQVGGFIEVESTPGKGTTFKIYLPLTNEDINYHPETKEHDFHKGHGRILVVDDMDLVLDFTRAFLQTAGYDVLVSTSAEQALDILDDMKDPIDLIFTDFNMAGMNGFDLIQKASQKFPNMKFILATGYIEEKEKRKIESLPNVHILTKPFQMRNAASLISKMLKEKRKNS